MRLVTAADLLKVSLAVLVWTGRLVLGEGAGLGVGALTPGVPSRAFALATRLLV